MGTPEVGNKIDKEDIENKLEQERQKLHLLIETRASKEEIQKQSEILDKEIIKHYPVLK